MNRETQTKVLNHLHDAKRRLEEAEGLVRAAAGNGAFNLLSYCRFKIHEAMKDVPVTSLDWHVAYQQRDGSIRDCHRGTCDCLGGSKRMAGERSGL